MKHILSKIRASNPLLFSGMVASVVGALVCVVLILFTNQQVLGINAWIKPLKFFLSIAIFIGTMGFFLSFLNKPVAVKAYSIMVIVVFLFEQVVIVWQASRGQLSHFNVSTPLDGALFAAMGIAITVLGLWTAAMTVYFFTTPVPMGLTGFWWGIRLGLVCFVVFSFEGGLMAARLRHTVGAPDGGPGLPLLNWSKQYGDLRIAHFVGMHALQVLPLLGYFLLKKPVEIILAAVAYAALSAYLFARAMGAMPLFF